MTVLPPKHNLGVMQASAPPAVSHMAHWYAADTHQQQQQQQQLGHHSGIAYGVLPHLACFLPPPYPTAQYPAYTAPAAVTGMPHVWVPVQINCDAAPYPGFYGQIHYPHSLHPGQQIPCTQARRPAAARSSQVSDPLQMAWPDSPAAAQTFSHHDQQGSADWAARRQQVSRHAPANCKATLSQPSTPAYSLQDSQQPQTPLNKQPAHLVLCDDTASSYSTASLGRPDTNATSSLPPEHQASLECTRSAEAGVSAWHASDDTHSIVAADWECVDDNVTEPAWQWLTLGLLREVMAELPQHCRKRCRLVCKRWRATMDLSVQVVLDLSVIPNADWTFTIWCTPIA